ncbi:MAG: hypothetical protein LBS72_04780 [Oscillospiraceae bacterium]|nr:hypothetical protein [Oscillospiraceae bacterium]
MAADKQGAFERATGDCLVSLYEKDGRVGPLSLCAMAAERRGKAVEPTASMLMIRRELLYTDIDAMVAPMRRLYSDAEFSRFLGGDREALSQERYAEFVNVLISGALCEQIYNNDTIALA